MLWAPNERTGRFLLDEIMLMGNYGKADERFAHQNKGNYFVRSWRFCSSKMRFLKVFPIETCWLPIDHFLSGAEMVLNKVKAKKMAEG